MPATSAEAHHEWITVAAPWIPAVLMMGAPQTMEAIDQAAYVVLASPYGIKPELAAEWVSAQAVGAQVDLRALMADVMLRMAGTLGRAVQLGDEAARRACDVIYDRTLALTYYDQKPV